MSRFYLAPESEDTFRRVSHSRVISHVAKKCECGKQTTAKDLAQYGHCVACQKETKKRDQAPTFAFTTGSSDYLAPGTGNRRFWPVPLTPKKARKA